MTSRDLREVTRQILGCAIEVHKNLGPGLLESTYRSCFAQELTLAGLTYELEVPVPILYKGLAVPNAYRADVIVEKTVLIELKAVAELQPIDTAQVLTYLRHSVLGIGLLINFSAPTLMKGVRRYVRSTNHPHRGSPLCPSAHLPPSALSFSPAEREG